MQDDVKLKRGLVTKAEYVTTSWFFCPRFLTAAILPGSGFGFVSFYLERIEQSQSILIHCPRSNVNNGTVVLRKNDINIFSIS